MSKIKGITLKINEQPRVEEIENDYKAFQNFVGGHIQALTISNDVVMIVNEEGKLMGLAPNFLCDTIHDVIVGDVIFVGTDGESFTTLTQEQACKVIDYIQYSTIRFIRGGICR